MVPHTTPCIKEKLQWLPRHHSCMDDNKCYFHYYKKTLLWLPNKSSSFNGVIVSMQEGLLTKGVWNVMFTLEFLDSQLLEVVVCQ